MDIWASGMFRPLLVQVQANTPTWASGAKNLLKRPAASSLQAPLPAAAPASAAQAWKLSTEEDGLVDEDDLLTEEDKAPVPAVGELPWVHQWL